MSDAYGKGIVRGQVDNTILRAYARYHDVTAAESINTCLTAICFGNNYVDAIGRFNDKIMSGKAQC